MQSSANRRWESSIASTIIIFQCLDQYCREIITSAASALASHFINKTDFLDGGSLICISSGESGCTEPGREGALTEAAGVRLGNLNPGLGVLRVTLDWISSVGVWPNVVAECIWRLMTKTPSEKCIHPIQPRSRTHLHFFFLFLSGLLILYIIYYISYILL